MKGPSKYIAQKEISYSVCDNCEYLENIDIDLSTRTHCKIENRNIDFHIYGITAWCNNKTPTWCPFIEIHKSKIS